MRLLSVCTLLMIFFNIHASNLDSLTNINENVSLTGNIEDISAIYQHQVDSLKKIIQDYDKTIVELQIEKVTLDSVNLKLKDLIEIERRKVKQREDSISELQAYLITMASNFLYIPYESYSIEKIAIPAFKATEGSENYVKYSNRLPLFVNYRDDIKSLIDFLKKTEEYFQFSLSSQRPERSKESLKIFNSMPVYINYNKYDDWEETFLGKKILTIQKILKTANESIPQLLKYERENLEELLKN